MLDNTITKADTLTDSLKDDLKKAQARLKQAKKDKKNTSKIEAEIATIKKEQADNKLNKKAAEKELKELYKQIEEETKPVIKKKFDYDIPIAMAILAAQDAFAPSHTIPDEAASALTTV